MSAPAAPSITGRGWGVAAIVAIAGAALLAWLLRRVIDHPPLYDELFHALAARGLNSSGQPTIADGVYSRAILFTHLVATSIRLLGDSLVHDRVPALLAGMGLVALAGFWTTRRAGWHAGLGAALVLCMMPATQQLAVFARFYTLHALVVLVIALLACDAVTRARGAMLRALLAVALAALAWHLQESTAIAMGAILAGCLAVLVLQQWDLVRSVYTRHPVAWTAAAVLAGAAFLVAVKVSGLLAVFNAVPLWAAGNAHRPQYYVLAFALEMPLLWALAPLAVLAAWQVDRRLTLFCATVLLVGLGVHSLAASKSIRYVYYLLPFLCLLWGCALAYAGAAARRTPRTSAIAAVATLAVLAFSQEGQRFARLLGGSRLTPAEMAYDGEPDWAPLAPALAQPLSQAQRLVTSNGMKALYYLGGYDLELNASTVRETQTGVDFGRDERTGRPAIVGAEALRSVLEQPGVTVVILEAEKIGAEAGVPAATMREIESRCAVLPLPGSEDVRAWTCAGQPAQQP